MDPKHFTVIAGKEVEAKYSAGVEAMRGTTDESLCKAQEHFYREGIEGVEVCPSMYGWSVRYDSGLNGFAVLASVRSGQLDGTRAKAIRCAIEWVSRMPAKRYAWIRVSYAELDERWPYGQKS